jgi:hypothetical protein
MRAALKYGIPAAAGLATGGYALSQGEDPGSAILAGAAGALGGYGGLQGARLAGKYSPEIAKRLQEKVVSPVGNVIGDVGRNIPADSKMRAGVVGKAADAINAMEGITLGPVAQRNVGKTAAALAIPAAAGAAGLGGVALGAIPGAMGLPGFQQQSMDPEGYGSSNTMMARSAVPTLRYA